MTFYERIRTSISINSLQRHQKRMRSIFYIFAININKKWIYYTRYENNDINNWKTRIDWVCYSIKSIRFFHNFLSSSIRQYFVNRFSVSEFAINQNASINKNLKNSNSKSLKQHTFAKSISFCCFCFCSILKHRSFHYTNLQIFSRSKFLTKFSTKFSFSWFYIFFVFRISFFVFAFIFSHLSHLFWNFLFERWSNWYLNHNQRIFSQRRSIKEMIYSFRNEIWKRRENNVTNMFEISIENLFYQRKFISKLVKIWHIFLFLTFDFHVDICFLHQIFSLCYFFSRHAFYTFFNIDLKFDFF